eukprot:scaffold2249_cov272-Pinguiococcus_pyrenoidosus.AAC.11
MEYLRRCELFAVSFRGTGVRMQECLTSRGRAGWTSLPTEASQRATIHFALRHGEAEAVHRRPDVFPSHP